jgi:hypothetical protein
MELTTKNRNSGPNANERRVSREVVIFSCGHCHVGAARDRAEERRRGGIMNFVKPRGSVELEKSAEREVEGNIRELVRGDSGAFRQADGDSETTANNLSALLRRVSGNSTVEIDKLISELRMLREKLLADGDRVERDIVEYAALSQSVIQMTKIITESMTQVKKLPVAPTLAE